jgi:alpha-tubulin suppressor-like RCC1 family protein
VVATAFAGRKVVAIAAGYGTSYALCDDGAVFAWGGNADGQLGIGTLISSPVPVAVTRTGPLADGTVVAVGGGASQGMALCADGRLAAWGWNHWGQIGDGTQVSPRTTAVAADLGMLLPGERVITPPNSPCTGSMFAQVAAPLPEAVTLPATHIAKFTAKLRGSVLARGSETRIWFEYGTTTAYGMTAAGNPAQVHWKLTTAATTATLSGLVPGTTYHYRAVAASDSGIARGADLTFTTISDNALLAELGHDGGIIAPGFEKQRFEYWSSVPFATTAVTVSAVTDHPRATFTVNGGDTDAPVSLAVGNNLIAIAVTAEDGETVKAYTITVNRLPQEFVFNAASDIPLAANGFAAGGNPAILVLGFAPSPGTILTMVCNTALGFIHGTFGNLAQGQRIGLMFDGRTYDFAANYFGGSGNDLVLQWADTKVVAWGSNNYGQLGDNSTTRRLLPGVVDDTGVLSGKTIIAVAEGYLHTLALCADGTLAAWGHNVYGQLGNASATPDSVPVAVDQTGVLADKSVIAISAGSFHNLALCSDGTVVAWGYNNYGQLGTGDKLTSRVPVLVNPVGALVGKQVVAVAAAAYHSFALCADGTLATWGYNDEGELGDGSTAHSLMPVAVDTSGVLSGKQIASLSAGQYHTLALCTDGTLVAWGYNNRGQLGNDSTVSSTMPIAIGSLAGKTVVATRASGAHSLALCADGTLFAWGWNNHGQLGIDAIMQSSAPLAIDTAGVGAAGSLTQIALGGSHSLALFADGVLAAWGDNAYGQLGNNNTTPNPVPGAVDMSLLDAGARFMFVASGSAALHNSAVVALPTAGRTMNDAWLQIGAGDDSDSDGIPNLIEYAFGLHLDPRGAAQLPQAQRVGDNMELRFTEPAGISGITYGAEWSATLLPGSWAAVPDTGAVDEHIFSVPIGTNPGIFMRLKVTGR